MLIAVNKITDHMIENNIKAVRLAGVESMGDLIGGGSPFLFFMYEMLNPLSPKDQQDAIHILKGLNI